MNPVTRYLRARKLAEEKRRQKAYALCWELTRQIQAVTAQEIELRERGDTG